jgi:uncharacterized coiled-coil DUF342 family protein
MPQIKASNTNTQNIDVIAYKIDELKKMFEKMDRKVEDLGDRFDKVENRQTAIEGKVGTLATLSTVFTIIASALAAFLGSKRL